MFEYMVLVLLGVGIIYEVVYVRNKVTYKKRNKRVMVEASKTTGVSGAGYEYEGEHREDRGYMGIPKEYHRMPNGVLVKMYGDNNKHLYRKRQSVQ